MSSSQKPILINNMKERLTTTFMSAWVLMILIATMMAITSCSSTSNTTQYGNNKASHGWGTESRCGK